MRRLSAVFLVLIAVGSWWLARPSAPSTAPSPGGAAPGYSMVDATFEETDATGRPALRVHAERATEDPLHHDVTLQRIRADYQSSPQTHWHVDAEAGRLPADGTTLLLSGDVVLRPVDGTGASVRTNHLDLDRRRQIATTSDEVRIEWPPHALVAHGLRADLTQRTLHLESPINGTFKR